MAIIEQFLGKSVNIPEDRQYDSKENLWVKSETGSFVFGLTEPALVLYGGLNDFDWLVDEGKAVEKGEAVLFALTSKILYVNTPISGKIGFNTKLKQNPSIILEYPYSQGWLFQIALNGDEASMLNTFADADTYIKNLAGSDGCKNPLGLKGGVSGICKAVYSGITEQQL